MTGRHRKDEKTSPIALVATVSVLLGSMGVAGVAAADTGTLTSARSFTPVTVASKTNGTTETMKVVSPATSRSRTAASSSASDSNADDDTIGADGDGLTSSVTVGEDEEWGGIETLDIPVTDLEEDEDDTDTETAADGEAATDVDSTPVETAASAALEADAAAESDVVAIALQYVGYPYVWGGASPATGFDCSGFTQYVYAQLGLSLPHQSESQRVWAQSNGVQVSAVDAQPGDLMWKYGHVGIYLGDGMMVHASTSSTGVIVSSASYASFEYYRII